VFDLSPAFLCVTERELDLLINCQYLSWRFSPLWAFLNLLYSRVIKDGETFPVCLVDILHRPVFNLLLILLYLFCGRLYV
jgi:hypothetical protein